MILRHGYLKWGNYGLGQNGFHTMWRFFGLAHWLLLSGLNWARRQL